MERKLVNISTLLTVAVLLLGMIAVIPTNAADYPGPRIYIAETPIDGGTIGYGQRFNVSIWIENVTLADPGLDGWQVELHYDDSIINVTQDSFGVRAWPDQFRGANKYNSSYVFYDATSVSSSITSPSYTHIGAHEGSLLIGDAIMVGTAWKGTKGLICIIEFEITATPEKLSELNCTLDITNPYTWIKPDELQNKATFEDGWYEWEWARPGPAHMGVQPTYTKYGPYPPSAVGEAFDIEVYIEDLDIMWELQNATFDLYYNATVIDVIGDEANVTFDGLWGTTSVTFTRNGPDVLDYMSIYVGDPTSTPGSSPPTDVLVCTIKFTVMMQSEVPTVPVGYVDSSPLNFQDEVLMDHYGCVDTAAPSNGVVDIYALISLPMALFKVEPSYIEYGPAPSVGEEFDVNVTIGGPTAEGLHFAWYLIGVQFRLYYDPSMLDVVSIEEGPFLKDGPWNLHGTFFIASVESDGFGPHVMIGDMLLPNSTGDYDMTSWPNGTGTIVTIRFRVADQPICPCNYTGYYWESGLDLGPLFQGEWAIDREGNWIPIDEASNVNGTYRIYESIETGRFIDLYGGAYNAGYGSYPFPAPYGGQGPNNPMDLVIPQSEIKLFASVKYNCWPVQSKDVSFEIEGPFVKNESDPTQLIPKYPGYQIWLKTSARTDADGIATITFRMPWPCEDPENITGIWLVTATVNIADEIVTDTMPFYYEYLVNWVKVTTDSYYYAHGECVEVTVEYRTHAMQSYPTLFTIALTDELGVPVDMALYDVAVGGATWCTWKEDSFTVEVCIPKWAFAGYAYIHVNAFDKDPTEGGFAWTPEYTPLPEIYITAS